MLPVPAGEEVAPKLARLLYFVGAGFFCSAAINKYRDWERKSTVLKQQQSDGQLLENQSKAVRKAVE